MGEYTYEQKASSGEVYVFECERTYIPELRQTRKVNRRLIGKRGKGEAAEKPSWLAQP